MKWVDAGSIVLVAGHSIWYSHAMLKAVEKVLELVEKQTGYLVTVTNMPGSLHKGGGGGTQ